MPSGEEGWALQKTVALRKPGPTQVQGELLVALGKM